jgi:magnesium chelatase family protein
MALAQVHGAVISGIKAAPIMVEVDLSPGLPGVGIIGLADTAVGEARWRLRSALGSTHITWPQQRITIGLSPADMPKRGTSLDLAMAVGLLHVTNRINQHATQQVMFFGELGLDGSVRSIRGGIAAAVAARNVGCRILVAAPESAQEAALIPGIDVVSVQSLQECWEMLRGASGGSVVQTPPPNRETIRGDFADVRGHEFARYACEVAAAGRHHMLFRGSPGIGKTMLAERFVTILPRLNEAEAVDVTTVASLAGHLTPGHGLIHEPPFQSPHHSASATAILGTVRSGAAIPGALTLAHHGVLFLDEAAEFSRPALEGLRQPLESGVVVIARAGVLEKLPARIQLLMAANPCPCGQLLDSAQDCRCSSLERRRYDAKLSGPLMDRIDVRITVRAPKATSLAISGETSSAMAQRVQVARDRARHRFTDCHWRVNAEIPVRELRRTFTPEPQAVALLERWESDRINLRSSDRIVRMAWSICDLRGGDRPSVEDLSGALSLRGDTSHE